MRSSLVCCALLACAKAAPLAGLEERDWPDFSLPSVSLPLPAFSDIPLPLVSDLPLPDAASTPTATSAQAASSSGTEFPIPTLNLPMPAIRNEQDLNSTLAVVEALPTYLLPAAVFAMYNAIIPLPTPTDLNSAMSTLSAITTMRQTDLIGMAADLRLNGFAGAFSLLDALVPDDEAFSPIFNSPNNNNPSVSQFIYQREVTDAPYDVSEDDLRSAIFLPPGFDASKKPVLFIPATSTEAYENFATTMGKLLNNSNTVDLVYVNIPGYMLRDVQENAEYVAYAINYMHALTGSEVIVISHSQGGLATQWALKYWPSARSAVSSFIAISPDFHGTVEAPLLSPPGVPSVPSILQQNYLSNFVAALRRNGGSTAYVPTTEIHSIFDEVVQPQFGSNASAALGWGLAQATNVQIQDVCWPITPAGAPVPGHEGALYSPVTFAVIQDIIAHGGAADIDRSSAVAQCDKFVTDGLTLEDVLAVEQLAVPTVLRALLGQPRQLVEPPIKAYAAVF